MQVPRPTLLQLVALLLAVLAISPFTAPFSTCDLGALANYDGPSLKFKVSSDHSLAGAPGSTVVRTAVAIAVMQGDPAALTDRPQILHTILRL